MVWLFPLPRIWGAPPSEPLPGPGQGLSPPPTHSLLRGPSAAQSEEVTGRHRSRVNVKATEFLLQPPAAQNQCGHAWLRLWPSVCLVNCCVPGTWVRAATVRSSSCPRRSHSFHETSVRPAQRFTEHLLYARHCSGHRGHREHTPYLPGGDRDTQEVTFMTCQTVGRNRWGGVCSHGPGGSPKR